MVDRLAFEHIKTVFHDMGLVKGNHRTRLEGDDIDVHVVAHIIGINETCGGPASFCARHGNRLNVVLVNDESLGHVDTVDLLVSLAYPVETYRRVGFIAQLTVTSRRQEGVATRHQDRKSTRLNSS